MMMDNATLHHHHHVQQVVQINPTSSANASPIIQHPASVANRAAGEQEHFLTIRLLMQGKVKTNDLIVLNPSNILRQEVGSIIGKRGDNIKGIREEVRSISIGKSHFESIDFR